MQPIGQFDLVLHVEAEAALRIDAVGDDGRVRERILAIDRIVDVYDIARFIAGRAADGQRAEPREIIIIFELVEIAADQDAMTQRSRLELTRQFCAQNAMFGIIAARPALARERMAIDIQHLPRCHGFGIRGEAGQQRVAMACADEQAPIVVQIMLQPQLMAGRARHRVTVAGLAQEARPWHRVEIAIQDDDTAIERHFHPRPFEIIGQARTLAERHADRGQEAPARLVNIVAEAVAFIIIADQPRRDPVCQGEIGVGVGADPVIAAILQRRRAKTAADLRLFGDQVDRPARLAPADEGRGRTFENLHPFDAGDITLAAEAAPGIEPVDEIAARQIFVAGKAANGEAVPEAAQRILPRDRGIHVERIGQAQDIVLLQCLGIDLGDGLRDFPQGEIAAIGLAHARDGDGIGMMHGIAGLGGGGRDAKSDRQWQRQPSGAKALGARGDSAAALQADAGHSSPWSG